MEAFLQMPWAPPGGRGDAAFGTPREVVRADSRSEVLPALERVHTLARSGCYAVGFVSYEAAPAFDPAMHVRAGSGMPLLWFGIHDAPLPAPRDPLPHLVSAWEPGTSRSAYLRSIAAIREAIRSGDTYQVNHTMRLRGRLAGDAYGAWRDLCASQGHGWFGYVDTGDHVVASASPELFFTWHDGQLTTRPMKGTRRRGRDVREDESQRRDLVESRKDRAENLMIVDLLRNDVARVCRPGTVRVPRLFEVEEYPTVWQLTSTVTGQTVPGTRLTDLFRALFPCGSITGAPKVSTMDIITRTEDRPRGVYCGTVGVVHPGGSAAFNVAIRTLVVGPDGRARYDVGGGVVWDSRGDDEYAEALAKAAVLGSLRPGVRLVETMRHDGADVVRADRHLDRLGRSARWLGWPMDRDAIEARLAALPPERARVRLTLGPGGDAEIVTDPLPQHDGEAWPVVVATEPIWSGDPYLAHKTTRREVYDQALALARRQTPQARDVILVNERGEVTELTIGNLVAEVAGARYTPPESAGLLPGVMRADLLDSGEIRERVLRVEDILRADRLWLVNSLRDWVELALIR